MKDSKFAWLCLTLSLIAGSVSAEEMPSFDQVRKRYEQTHDLTRVSYLYRRCAALQLNLAAILIKNKKVQASQDYESLARHYMLLSEAVDKETDMRRDVKTSKTIEAVDFSVKLISETYRDRMRENFQKRGEYFAGDKVLESELAECLKPELFARSLGR